MSRKSAIEHHLEETLNPKGKIRICIADMAALMEKVAPSFLAESWDNCGLQVGDLQWPVKKVWVALDPLLSVVESAAGQGVDLLIAHHPLIFKPLRKINLDTNEGKIIAAALKGQVGIYAAHTNLDSASDGINDVLARKIGLDRLVPLVPAKPAEIHDGENSKIELAGMGRIGRLNPPKTVSRLAMQIKKKLGLPKVKVAGNADRVVAKVAVCSGSGGGLLDEFLASEADVFVSGDLRYHDARAVEDSGRALIDIGHFASEHLIVDALFNKLEQAVNQAGWNVQIAPCQMEKDPFELL
jgi:dinuclear metal center YbgI/SA1388 family protein